MTPRSINGMARLLRQPTPKLRARAAKLQAAIEAKRAERDARFAPTQIMESHDDKDASTSGR